MSTVCFFFFFNDTATTEIYTLSLHDALPISEWAYAQPFDSGQERADALPIWLHTYNHHRAHTALGGRPPISRIPVNNLDRKSTRLNSSHANISYAVFCLKKKKRTPTTTSTHR